MSQIEGSSLTNGTQDQGNPSQIDSQDVRGEGSHQPETSNSVAEARQRRRIAQLEEKLEALESGRAVREKQMNYYVAQGRAVRHVISLFNNTEDLVAENDRWYEVDEDADHTLDQDRLQVGYITLMNTLQWFHNKGDNTSKLKALVSEWVNCEFKPDPLVDPDDKHTHRFINDGCGRLLCPAELNWNDPAVRAGICDHSDSYFVTDLSFPAFLYEKYASNPDDLEEGLFKGKILLQSYKAVFTLPSSAKAIEGDGDGADIIENNRCTRKACFRAGKVKKHVAQIIKMEKVTPRSITYIVCQPPGREAWRRVDKLLEWWTRKVFGRSCHNDLSNAAKANMSVNALARQRAQHDDALFDSL
ncbi:uncharacterized protein F5891DRAFT_1189790 [Suillus fuscotomentosus]|uniref:Uncharacterized protein n=1 Tax=Suillus fuscotomentosus TaxID=1912939 RepID=A0AAD4E450_9AGAM|nr:uncharacterized protein F5891DRAFT_1189790 [Suillus fuscotomentosus]KAG1899346.1 hypothetical protein F5891DRAFT_1189790 [Suillus fuscotomentosus]